MHAFQREEDGGVQEIVGYGSSGVLEYGGVEHGVLEYGVDKLIWFGVEGDW